jgi:predicted RNA-binding Zn ribbon-like protein
MAVKHSFIGGAVCLDFVNTASRHPATERIDYLPTYADLVRWARQAGVVGAGWQPDAGDGADTLRRAVILREALFQAFARTPGSWRDRLAVINAELRDAMAHVALVPGDHGIEWSWQAGTAQPADRVLWPVVRSAADLLASPMARKVVGCGNDDCGWLFIDGSGRRRWCAMQRCGNRAKVARYYQRHKGVTGSPA